MEGSDWQRSVNNGEPSSICCVERAPEDASMIESWWVMVSKLLVNHQTDKWKVRVVGHGDQQQSGDYTDITFPVINSISGPLAFRLAARRDHVINILNIPTVRVWCPLQVTVYMCLPDSEWPDPYCGTHPIVNLDETMYCNNHVNREYSEDVFHYIVDCLSLQGLVVAPGHCFGGTLSKPNGIYPDTLTISWILAAWRSYRLLLFS